MRTTNIAFEAVNVFLLTFFLSLTVNATSLPVRIPECLYDRENPSLDNACLNFKSLDYECAGREIEDFISTEDVTAADHADANILLAAIYFAGNEDDPEKRESAAAQFKETYGKWRGNLDLNSSRFLKLMLEARAMIDRETEEEAGEIEATEEESPLDISAMAESKPWYKKWWEIGPGMKIVAPGAYSDKVVWSGLTESLFDMLILTADYTGHDIQTVASSDRVLKVDYAGGIGEISGVCYHRPGGAASYSASPMQAGDGDAMTITVPGSDIGIRGYEFYFELHSPLGGNSAVGSADKPFILIADLSNALARRPAGIPANQYRIIGLPINVKCDPMVTGVFGDDFTNDYGTYWRLGSFNRLTGNIDEYPDAIDAGPGRGYWLMMRNPVPYGAAGYSMRPNNFDYDIDYYQMSLDSGWNMIANPFAFDVDWPAVRFLDADTMVTGHNIEVLEDFAYWYNGTGYSSVTSLSGWDGFFVFVKKPNVSALFPYLECKPSPALPLNDIAENASLDNWSIHLSMQSDWLIDDGNFIGVRKDALAGDDIYDLSEPPSPPDAPRLAFVLPEGDPRPRRADYRPPFDEGAEWKLEITPGQERIITASGIENLPSDMVVLLILNNGDNFTLVENSSIGIPDEVTSARLFIGTSLYLASEAPSTLPDEFELGQNHPNPFNPFTVIDFALPKGDHITLEVYNIIGQRVKTLVDEDLDAGEYTIEWHGDDEENQPVASGIYFYRMKAGNYIQCRKMLLLK